MKKNIFKINKIYWAVAVFTLVSVAISCQKDDENSGDIVNPYVISYNPVSGVDGVATNSNLVLTFDDIVVKGEGNITITTDVEQGNQVIDVNSDAVTLDNVNRVMTINPSDFLSGRTYQVVLDAGLVNDLAGNAYFGMPAEEAWSFTTGGNTGDLDAPELASVFPADDETDAPIFTLELTFNETVRASAGNINVYDSNDQVVMAIDGESESVVANKEKITITLAEPLSFGENYYVEFDAGVIKDAAGNDFVGITDKTAWNFTTTAGSGSDLVVHLPLDEDLADISGNRFDAVLGSTASASVEFVDDATRGKVANFLPGSFAQLPRHDLLRPNAESFSFNMWVKIPGIASDPAILSNKDWGSGGNPGFVLCVDDGDAYEPGNGVEHGWVLNCADNPKNARIDWRAATCNPPAPALSDDAWHMVTVVFNRTSQKLSVYLDGVEYGNSATASFYDLSTIPGELYDVNNDYPITLFEDGTGSYNAGSDTRKQMTGLMDELTIYNKALTVDEIKTLFEN